MEKHLSHSLRLGKSLRILLEDLTHVQRQIKRTCVLVIYWPVTLRYHQTVQLIQTNQSRLELTLLGMNNSVISLWILHVLHNNIASLKSRLTKSHLQQLNVANLLIDVVVLYTHQFLRHHVLVLPDKSLLRPIKTNQHSHQINLLIFHPSLNLLLLAGKYLPLLSSILILFTTHLLYVLLRRNLHHLPRQLRIVLDIVSQMGNNASQSIVSLQQIVFDRNSYLLENHTLRIQYLKNLQHVDVLIQNTLSYHSGNQQTFLNFSLQILPNLI